MQITYVVCSRIIIFLIDFGENRIQEPNAKNMNLNWYQNSFQIVHSILRTGFDSSA